MNERSYTKAVSKRLVCSKARRDEFVRDLESDIAAARAAGERWEQIERRMGDPRQVASEFNEDLSDAERAAGKRRKRNRIVAIVAAVVVALAAVLAAATWWATPHQGPTVQVEDAASQPAVAQAQKVVELFDAHDGDGLRALSSKQFAELFTDQVLDDARASVSGGDWGAFVSFDSAYLTEITQMGQRVEVVRLAVRYEDALLTYTLSFDADLKLIGFYVA